MNIDKKKFSFDFLGSISFKEKLKLFVILKIIFIICMC